MSRLNFLVFQVIIGCLDVVRRFMGFGVLLVNLRELFDSEVQKGQEFENFINEFNKRYGYFVLIYVFLYNCVISFIFDDLFDNCFIGFT